jgi:16S rRNA (cytosine1402-N4)-methyltransferase
VIATNANHEHRFLERVWNCSATADARIHSLPQPRAISRRTLSEPMLQHTPVLLEEALAALDVRKDGTYIDATLGRGGHSAAILQQLGPDGRLIAIDRDPAAISAGRTRFAADARVTLVHSAFSRIANIAAELGVLGAVDGLLIDLGVSSPQLDDGSRGFSFGQDGPLDMRMDNSAGQSAETFVARASEQELARVIREYGEERFAKRIARAIVAARSLAPITRTTQLAQIVAESVPIREPGKNPATRTFQALRIQVNDEFGEIRSALNASLKLLKTAGRLCVISFHSLEDGIVKRFIQKHSQEDPVYAGLPNIPEHAMPKLRRVAGAIHPSESEIANNVRARSAVLRTAEKVSA